MAYSKYFLYKKQVSFDGGETWEDTDPLETTTSGDPIATYETLEECENPFYLTIVPHQNGELKFSARGNYYIEYDYSVDSGHTWSSATSETIIPLVSGDKVMFKGELTADYQEGVYWNGIGTFSASTPFDAEGNPMSLLFGEDFSDKKSLAGKVNAFGHMFHGSSIVNAENLILPATVLSEMCYSSMFFDCASLVTTPQLVATNLSAGTGCYTYMFGACTSLITAPELIATELSDSCYGGMFAGCTSLTTAPELPATVIYQHSYQGMFSGCTSLTTAPKILPAMELPMGCYDMMFMNCTSLRKAPELPSTSGGREWCYLEMFRGCSSLNEITCLLTNSEFITGLWVVGVSSSGTFTKAANSTYWDNLDGDSGIPTGWSVRTK